MTPDVHAPPDPLVELARRLYLSRRRRPRFLPDRILGEPGFDILLDLLVRAADGRAVATRREA